MTHFRGEVCDTTASNTFYFSTPVSFDSARFGSHPILVALKHRGSFEKLRFYPFAKRDCFQADRLIILLCRYTNCSVKKLIFPKLTFFRDGYVSHSGLDTIQKLWSRSDSSADFLKPGLVKVYLREFREV